METKEQAIRDVFFAIKRMRETARRMGEIEREVALDDALYTFRNRGIMEEVDIISSDNGGKQGDYVQD